jgi:hypothetical protein
MIVLLLLLLLLLLRRRFDGLLLGGDRGSVVVRWNGGELDTAVGGPRDLDLSACDIKIKLVELLV